ncbi:EXOSOME COMPLEX EXONUCLEASE (RIBOSOMAL RNA PROCESSING PROTEIN) [Ceraceosorus bombacis]|uniref:Ribosomal RNA-processing protein 42 n=1 Tax=Ceraceosorus bombacis TaxID=401625 RepID=A0A0N7L8W8_9BASI|nr:EXOSOME COMPLEX EXONUCLEASE (RIBOSOMAL RNA PROCESSING PROTEIN) [Ceraceosorus bombacis]
MATSRSEQSLLLASLVSSAQSGPSSSRPNARPLDSARPLEISCGLNPNAAGSAEVARDGTRASVVIGAEVREEGEGGWEVACDISSSVANIYPQLASTFETLLASALPAAPYLTSPGLGPQWYLTLDARLLSADGGNALDCLLAASWAAVNDVRLPQTRRIGAASSRVAGKGVPSSGEHQNLARSLADQAREGEGLGKAGLSGLKGFVSGADRSTGGPSGAKDFELVEGTDMVLAGAPHMGVAVTLALLPRGLHLLDPNLQEEIALPPHLRLCVIASPSEADPKKPVIWSARLLSDPPGSEVGASGRDAAAGAAPAPAGNNVAGAAADESRELLEEAWGAPDLSRVRGGIKLAALYALQLHEAMQAQVEQSETER